jgi:hypothetical protein
MRIAMSTCDPNWAEIMKNWQAVVPLRKQKVLTVRYFGINFFSVRIAYSIVLLLFLNNLLYCGLPLKD